MAYTKIDWKNYPDTSTPVTAENLNHMEQGIVDNAAAIAVTDGNVSTNTADISTLDDKVDSLDEAVMKKANFSLSGTTLTITI